MRVTNIDLYSSDMLQVNFSLRDPALQDQFIVKGWTGLDAESIVPKLTGRSIFTKAPYYSMVLEPRTIVLRLAINPRFDLGQTYSNLRDYLYRVISLSRSGDIQLVFNDGDRSIAGVRGRITKFEASHSTAQPEIQLTILCKDGRLQSLNQVTVDISEFTTVFPFVNEFLDSLSTAPHGCVVQLVPAAGATYFQIQGSAYDASGTDWFFKIQPGNINGDIGFIAGDLLTINAEPGDLWVRLNRTGRPGSPAYSIADKIVVGSSWPTVFFGTNGWICTGGIDHWVGVKYYNTYWGV